MDNRNLSLGLLLVGALIALLCFLSKKDDTFGNSAIQRVPTSLITGAVAYRTDPNDISPFIRNGRLTSKIIDSVLLSEPQILEITRLANSPLSEALSFPGCFYPTFIVKFTGGYLNEYVGHITVSIDCQQIKFTDNSGIHVLTEEQIVALKFLYENLFGLPFQPYSG